MSNVILHVGIHKTGTSSIQQTFGGFNPKELKSQGYVYPIFFNGKKDLTNHSAVFYSLFTESPLSYHLNIRWGVNTSDKIDALHALYKKQLAEVFDSGIENIIISGEDISSLSISSLQSLKSYLTSECSVDNIKVICATREHISYLSSAIQEQVKNGSQREIAISSLSKKLKSMYRSHFHKFEVVFGCDNINVYKFEDSIRDKKGIFNYFVENYFPDLELAKHKEVRINESLCYEGVELISYINRRFSKLEKNPEFNDILFLHNLRGNKFYQELPNGLLNKIKDDQNWLNDNYELEYQTPPLSDNIIAYWSDDTLSQIKEVLPKLNSDIRSFVIEFLRDKAISIENENLILANKMMLIAK